MSKEPESKKFKMSPPGEHGGPTRYAFWLQTEQAHLFRYVEALICVQTVTMKADTRGLVSIKDDYDADEAWHYIRTEMEGEANVVPLDKIWEDAMAWL